MKIPDRVQGATDLYGVYLALEMMKCRENFLRDLLSGDRGEEGIVREVSGMILECAQFLTLTKPTKAQKLESLRLSQRLIDLIDGGL